MLPRRTTLALVACAVAVLVAGCGGGDKTTASTAKPKTVTVTTPATSTATPTAPTTTTATTPTSTDGDETSPPPAGTLAANGVYDMAVRTSDWDGENIIVDDENPQDANWRFATNCNGQACTVVMRRALSSGGFKEVQLQPAQGRPGVFEANTSGMTGCATGDRPARTTQRWSVRLHNPKDVDGRQIAASIDAYMTERTKGCPNSSVAVGKISWGGKLLG